MTDDWGKTQAEADILRFKAAVVDASVVDLTEEDNR